MGAFAPLFAAAFLLGMSSIWYYQSNQTIPSVSSMKRQYQAQTFLQYRNGVMTYLANNPNFTGTVTPLQLTNLGFSFSSAFLANTSNVISSVPGETNPLARSVVCYSTNNLAFAGLASKLEGNDASIGIAAGNSGDSPTTSWSPIWNPAGITLTLPVAVPAGSAVSFIGQSY